MDVLEAIKWPISFILGLIAFLIIFKSPIQQKILNLKSIKGPKNSHVNFSEQQENSENIPLEAANELKLNNDDLMRALSDPNTPSVVKRVSLDLLKGIETVPESKKVNILILFLAEARTELVFERIYRIIYGSQIKFLRHLNNFFNDDKAMAQAMFETYHQNNSLANKKDGFEKWLHFLKNQELIIENDNQLQITEAGRDFLIYMTKNRLLEEKFS